MNWLIYLFGSGAAFFLGVGLLLVGVATCTVTRRNAATALATLTGAAGLLLVAISATPLPYWLYALAGGVSAVWLAAERSRNDRLRGRRHWWRAATVAGWAVAAAVEVPHHWMPTVPRVEGRTLAVIGDSVSAGIEDRERPWPRQLAESHNIEVTNLSRVGAGVAQAVRQAERLPADAELVLLEIGGNDLLGSTTAAEFETGLDELLTRVCRPGRVVLMFEMPLPPFHNAFGRTQRRLAARYGVRLIPKRVFAAAITGDDATLDSIHLSPAGHMRMADAVWQILRPAYEP